MDKIILNKTEDIRKLLNSYKLNDRDYLSILLDLLDVSDSREDNVIFIGIVEVENIVCAGLFSVSKRQILGVSYNTLYLYGYSFFDYNQIFADPLLKENFISLLRHYSELHNLDLALLENIKSPLFYEKCISQKNIIQLFDNSLVSKGFSYISGKKSLRRHVNVVKRDFNYKVEHLKGSAILDENYQDLISLHKERWGFDNVNSAFEDKKRINFYKKLKGKSLMTIITLDNEVLAIHFGILNDKRLIWHTPVLNVKFLEFSPIEVLLYETSNFCATNNIQFLDFGLGDEKYKFRFSNSEELIYDYIIPFSVKTNLTVLFTKYLKNMNNLFNPMHLIKIGHSFLNKIKQLNNSINFYKFTGGSLGINDSIKEVKFKQIKSYVDFVDFVRLYNGKVKRFQFKRFKEGDFYYCLHNNSEILCYGWSKSKSIFISEINKEFSFDKGYVLYDFNTVLDFRRKGYYKYLLKRIIAVCDTDLYIYSLSNNTASNKAIKAVGFNMIKLNI